MKNLIAIGTKFGHWTIIGNPIIDCKSHHRKYLCECDCEKHTRKYVDEQNLKRGLSASCGCETIKSVRQRRFKHGQAGTRLFHIWVNMKSRCFNSHDSRYSDYGGRGITVCKEWIESFIPFHDWAINNGYNDNLTIDRMDVNGNYEPSNCRWATNKEQCNNRRSNTNIIFNGETHNLTQWAEMLGIKATTIGFRLKKGYPLEDVFFCGDLREKRR